MTTTFRIKPFSSYVLRTPLLPLTAYLDTIDNYSTEKAKKKYKNSLIREAIYLASPDLINELDKWIANDLYLSDEKAKKLEITFLKYLARMSSRCTPFGLFAGCSVGRITSDTEITMEDSVNFKRFTEFDMQFWVSLLQNIAKRETAISHLKYFPNSSIYEFGDFYRYIEYNYIKTQREHTISAFRKSDLLAEIILKSKSGLTSAEMISLLANNDSEKDEATKFIHQLINYQFLVSEFDAVVTGNNEFDRVLSILKNISALKKEYEFLKNIDKQISDLDTSLIPTPNQYQKIRKSIDAEGFEYNEKYLFQTDLNTTTRVNNLNKTVIKKVTQGLCFLNGIYSKKESKNLNTFVREFSKRYESQEMPLINILDTESGLGYPVNHEMHDSHEILEGFSFKQKGKKSENQIWNSFDFILEKKLQEYFSNNQTKIILSENDFPDFHCTFDHVPATFSVLIEIYGDEKIAIESSGSLSAAKILGRFCNGSPDIHNLTKEIIEKEEAFHHDKILAEIVHIPQSRTGNILRRPVLRNYEIVYLANSGVEKKNVIDLNDLFLSVKNDKIILRSKKLDKEIIPCLSNAHNFTNNSLPLYHFLCDLQSQHSKPIFNFDWGVLEHHYNYFPRVEYKEVILSKAKWIITKEDLTDFNTVNSADLLEAFSNWRINKNIPYLVNWANLDNTLLLDFRTEIGIELFLKSTHNRSRIILEEFLFSENSIVKNSNGEIFSNQFIVSFYKEQS